MIANYLADKRVRFCKLLLLIFLLTQCTTEDIPLPELIELAPTPSPVISQPTAAPSPTATNLPPTITAVPFEARDGIQAASISSLASLPAIDPPATTDWRPPAMVPPISYHPNDHYWLTRPILPNQRNYDLEWYPYGNDVLIAALAPYRIHHGIDYPNPSGTQVFAAASGTIIWAGPRLSPRNGVNYYGNTVIIKHDWQWQGKDIFTLYAHTLELFVTVGDHVKQGELIAGVGASGDVSGAHLHLEIRVGENNYASTRNPALWVVPYDGWGTLAGRFEDRNGRPIHGAAVTLYQKGSSRPFRQQRTYASFGINGDDLWQENFAIADLPAGAYTLELETRNTRYRHEITIRAGQTSFISIPTSFTFVPTRIPTATPIPSPTSAGTPEITPSPQPTP